MRSSAIWTPILASAAFASLASALSAQTPPPPPGPGPPPTWKATPPNARSSRFEVATIKRSTSLSPFGSLQPAAGRLTIANMTLEAMLKAAYGRNVIVEGLPAWARSERYDVAAKAYDSPDFGQLMLALRALLGERFGLAVHQETREVPVFVLKVDGKASKLRTSRGPKDPNAPQLTSSFGSSNRLSGRHASIDQLIRVLSTKVDRLLTDGTGLTGEYDFDANWSSEEYPGGVSVFTALREQLGLRLESARGPAQVLVIDNVNRTPTDN